MGSTLLKKKMTKLEMFAFFSYNCDYNEMITIFGEPLGEHFWNKLEEYHRDWGRLLWNMSSSNIKIMEDYITKKYQ